MEIINVGNRIINNYLYKIRDGYVLIDTGYEHGFQNFLRKIKSKGIHPEDISFVFLTHAHDDHAGFLNQLLKYASNIKVIIHPKALETLYRGQNSFEGGCTSYLAFGFCKLMGFLGKGEHRFPPYETQFNNRLIVLSEDNRKDVEVALCGKIYETPGHTSDSISLLCYDGTLFCGDAAMNGLPSLHRITIWVENKKEYINSWKKIINLQPKVILPSHGNGFSYKQLIKNMRYVESMSLIPLLPTK